MDPLSISASIAGLVTLTASCLKLSKKWIGPSEFGTAELKAVEKTLLEFTGAMKTFETFVEIYEDDEARPVTELYERYKPKRTRPSIDELSKALQDISSSLLRAFILIDALDECQVAYRPRLIKEVLSLQARCRVNLLMTSRFLPEITDNFDRSCWLEIRASREDVERYLEDHIQHSSRAIQKIQGEIKTAISDAVDGMYVPY
jgi:hypothetical protein